MSENAAQVAPPKEQIDFDTFTKIDLRVAKILEAEVHPNADRLLTLRLDDGTAEGRQVCAGIKAWYDPIDLVGKLVVIVANLAPRTIRGEISQGMVLAAASGEGESEDVVVLTLDRPAVPGTPVS